MGAAAQDRSDSPSGMSRSLHPPHRNPPRRATGRAAGVARHPLYRRAAVDLPCGRSPNLLVGKVSDIQPHAAIHNPTPGVADGRALARTSPVRPYHLLPESPCRHGMLLFFGAAATFFAVFDCPLSPSTATADCEHGRQCGSEAQLPAGGRQAHPAATAQFEGFAEQLQTHTFSRAGEVARRSGVCRTCEQ